MSRENTRVECPVCDTKFVTSTDSDETQCPICEFIFDLATGE